MEDDAHQPDELSSPLRVIKTYLKKRYRLLDLLRARRNDRMTSNLKRWIENGAPDEGYQEEDSYRILRQYYMQKEGRVRSEQGSDRGLQKERGGQGPVQLQRDSLTTTLSNRIFIQVA